MEKNKKKFTQGDCDMIYQGDWREYYKVHGINSTIPDYESVYLNTEKKLNGVVFLIAGESACGKDILCNMLEEDGYKVLKSYSTRPRRINEKETHEFITPEEVEKYKDDMVAYTKIGDYEYFSTKDQLIKSHIYIIDPIGIKYIKEKVKDIRLVVIYINVNENERRFRATNIRKDDVDIMNKRFEAERGQFDEIRLNANFDYSVSNYNLKKSYQVLKNIIEIENK